MVYKGLDAPKKTSVEATVNGLMDYLATGFPPDDDAAPDAETSAATPAPESDASDPQDSG